ncbi:unnamed protein product [Parnassius mnemosyne]|uniref:Gustatory receptor n=1 Tax=Parnassius mnemosyne TaxID=213953 RepID=A0AAV1M8I6_9NEOP
MKRYKNIIEAWYLVNYIKSIMGARVLYVKNTIGDDIERRLSYFGLFFFLIWYILYFYCTCISYMEEQTVLRILYDTKLKQYGDYVENIISLHYVLYVMWKVPFDLSGSTVKIQELIDIDKTIESMCEPIDYTRSAFITLLTFTLQLGLSATKMMTLWLILSNFEVAMPFSKMYQIVFVEILVLNVASCYCFYLISIRARYIIVNKVLKKIKNKKSLEQHIFVHETRQGNIQRALQVQEKYVCEKIKTCAKTHSLLYHSTESANKKFGFALAFTMFLCLITIILYLFYLMEATASGLFHNVPRYCEFLAFVFWQIIVAIGVVYVIVYFCELTTAEAKATAIVTHQIINNNFSPVVTSEAMQLSLQLLHQVPVFTARGLYKLDYLIILEGARSVVTFLVMLIQFVTDPPSAL